MRKLLIFLIVCVAIPAEATMTNRITGRPKRWTTESTSGNPLYKWQQEAQSMLEAGTTYSWPALYFGKTDTEPTASEGMVYYDDSEDCLKVRGPSSWVAITTGTGDNTLDNAYDQPTGGAGKAVTVDSGAIALTATNAANNTVLSLVQEDTSAASTLVITGSQATANAISIDIDAQSTGRDIEGTGATWYVTGGGAATFVEATIPTLTVSTAFTLSAAFTASSGIVLDSGDTLTNSTDTEIRLNDTGGEDLIFDLDAGSNAVGLKTSTGVDELAMGAVDDLTGVGTIAFDAAASTVSLASTGAAQDLTIEVTGANNASLHLASAGTAGDAMTLATSAGGMDLTVAGAAADEDLDLLSNTSINITATEAAADAIVLTSSGGFDLTAVDDIDIGLTSGGAGEDILVTQTGANDSSIVVTAAGTGADAISLAAAAGTVKIAGNFVDMDSTEDFNITVTSSTAGEDMLLTQTGGNESSITLSAAGTGTDAIGLQASAGGVDIDAVDDLAITVASTTTADDLTITQTGANNSSIIVTAAGTGTDAIKLNATAGGMDIDATDDLNILLTTTAADDDLVIATTGSDDTHISITADGTSANALGLFASGTGGGIDVDTADGAVSIVADGAANGDITIDAQDQITIVSTDADGTDSIYIHANGGASENIKIHADQGTGDASIVILSDAGGIDVDAAKQLSIVTSETDADSLVLGSSGGIDITATGASAKDLDIVCTNGSLNISGGEADAAAVTIAAAAGGMTLTTVATYDIAMTANGGTVQVVASEAAANQFKVDAQGTIGGNAIVLETTAGGIQMLADGGTQGDIDIDCEDDMTLTAAGDMTFAVTGTISVGDSGLTNVGDIACDDIVDDTSGDIMYMLKTVVKTIDLDDDASTDDFQFDDDQANQTEQPVDLGAIIPAYAEIVSAQIRCFETVTGSAQMSIDLGTATGGAEILAAANTDTANDINATGAGDGPEVVATNAARNVWINATPNADWDSLDAGRWAVMVTYIDYGAVYTQKSP